MSQIVPVIVPQETVNDESVTLLAWLVTSGDIVVQGQKIAEIETSKAVIEIEASASGVVEYSHEPGSDVEVGGVLCRIHGEKDSSVGQNKPVLTKGKTEKTVPSNGEPPQESGLVSQVASQGNLEEIPMVTTNQESARLSKQAKALAEKRGITADRFVGRGLVRTSDILHELGEATDQPSRSRGSSHRPVPTESRAGKPMPAVGVSIRTEKLPRSKRTEIQYLSSSSQNSLTSVVNVIVPTRGLRAAIGHYPQLQNSATAIILFEIARLLRRYPQFNAFYTNGHINYYEDINIGFALDADKGLKVPVIRAADTKNIQDIATEMQELLVTYLNDQLPNDCLIGSTFTITDLSGEGVFSFHPLLNQGQSAILGIGSEFLPPGSGEGFFNLILAFDHQLSEGRQAAKFLRELADHLQAYENALQSNTDTDQKEKAFAGVCCSRCLTPFEKLKDWDQFQHWDHFMVPTVQPNGESGYLCSVCLRGW